ncbi:MAG: DUF2789 domain-containing protein [Curvibacter sp.]|nr:DUF2789 domain-containing protein [Curvibacter sp.]
MDTSPHDLPHLFRQLGLPSSPADIDAFVSSHRLPPGTTLPLAAFWTPAQAALLTEGLCADADWSEAIDELATRLS